jgi:ribosomal protein S21
MGSHLVDAATQISSEPSSSESMQGSQFHRLHPLFHQTRGMAVWVDVEDGNVEAALGKLNRKLRDSGLLDELRKRQYHMRESQLRFQLEKKAYNRAMARTISRSLNWLKRRRVVRWVLAFLSGRDCMLIGFT